MFSLLQDDAMDNYVKGRNVEEETTWDDVPFRAALGGDRQDHCVWVKVRGGSKIRNLVPVAERALAAREDAPPPLPVLISGSGPALPKVITIAEIVKRK